MNGGKRILAENHPVIYAELWDNQNRENCMKLLSDLSYTPYVVVENKLTVFNKELHKNQNFIFISN